MITPFVNQPQDCPLTINLTQEVATSLQKEADELGITAEELARFILGQRQQANLIMRSRFPQPGTDNSAVLPSSSFMEGFNQSLAFTVQLMTAMTGRLHCEECGQTLTTSDVIKRACANCGHSLAVLEQQQENQPAPVDDEFFRKLMGEDGPNTL